MGTMNRSFGINNSIVAALAALAQNDQHKQLFDSTHMPAHQRTGGWNARTYPKGWGQKRKARSMMQKLSRRANRGSYRG